MANEPTSSVNWIGRSHVEAELRLHEHQHARFDGVRDDGGPRRAGHAPLEAVDEGAGQRHVHHVGDDRRHHRRARVALSVAHLAERDIQDRHRRAERPDAQVGARALTRLGGGRDVRQDQRHQLAAADGDEAGAEREHQRGAEVRADLVGALRADGLRHQRLDPAEQAKRKAQQPERQRAAEAHARQLRRAEPADQQRVDQRHHAVRQRRHGDRPREPHQLRERTFHPTELLIPRTCFHDQLPLFDAT